MRTRNIKINVFLNEEEKEMLLDKSKKTKLSQSEFFRMLIQDYSDKKVLNKDIEYSIKTLNDVIDNLNKLSNTLNRLCYYDFVFFLDSQISSIRNAIDKIQK